MRRNEPDPSHVSQPQLAPTQSQQSIAVSGDYHSLSDYASSASARRSPDSPARYSTPPLIAASPRQSRDNVGSEATVAPVRRAPARYHTAGTGAMDPSRAIDGVVGQDSRAAHHPSVPDQATADPFDQPDGPPTPEGDNRPYIQYALDQITRNDARGSLPPFAADDDDDDYTVERVIPDEGLGYMAKEKEREKEREKEQERLKTVDAEAAAYTGAAAGAVVATTSPPLRTVHTKASTLRRTSSADNVFVPYRPSRESLNHPPLTFLPLLLRPGWLGSFILLCALMTVALVFTAIWSATRNGLWTYGNFGDGRYFAFQYLPALLGMVVLVWLLQIQVALQRISPFIAMASPSATSRSEGLFLDLSPSQFLLPSFQHFRARQPIIGLCFLVCWAFLFTVPLLSSSFSVRYYNAISAGSWRWVACQGTLWTVIVLYILLILALALLGHRLWRRETGLKWDPSSIADIVAMLERSNIVRDYAETETFHSRPEIRARLASRADRLGYWHTSHRPQDVFYGIGEEGGPTRVYAIQQGRITEKSAEKRSSLDEQDEQARRRWSHLIRSPAVRFRHIPCFLSESAVLAWVLAAFVFLVAFYVVSYLNNAVKLGFLPHLPTMTDNAGFSASNFLYSFIPGQLGLLLFLLILPLDYSHRQLQPFVALANANGATVEESLLVDYVARLPVSVTIAAAANRHYRVAVLSLASLVALPVPVLAGGVFWAQYFSSARTIRMAAHMPGYYTLSVFLGLYALLLLFAFPTRRHRLPHATRCVSDVISWLYMSRLITDPAFRRVCDKTDLVTRLITNTNSPTKAFAAAAAPTIATSNTNTTNQALANLPAADAAGPRKATGAAGLLGSLENLSRFATASRDRLVSRLTPDPARRSVGSLVISGPILHQPLLAAAATTTAAQHARNSPLSTSHPAPSPISRLRYGFGIFIGRDGQQHLGIDRVQRGGASMIIPHSERNARRSWSRSPASDDLV